MMSLEEKIKSFVMDQGADFVGVASHTRFEAAPPWSDPKKYLPDFRSVIAFGIAMNRGALEAWFSKRTRRPLVLQDKLAVEELDKISLKLSRLIERGGFKTAFFSQNGQYNAFRGKPDFSHKHAAVAAGLGRLGLSSNFVNLEYGAAVHISSVISEVELVPDAIVSDENNPCSECKTCLQICPEQAMRPDAKTSFIMEGKTYTHQKLDPLRCAWGCAGLSGHQYSIGNRTVGTWAYNDLPRPDNIYEFSKKFIEADRSLRNPKEIAEIVICKGTEYCGNCGKICVGSKKDTAALFKLHLNSGTAEIPDDPTLILNTMSSNENLNKYHVDPSEINALTKFN